MRLVPSGIGILTGQRTGLSLKPDYVYYKVLRCQREGAIFRSGGGIDKWHRSGRGGDMKVAAMIFGILAGLSGFLLAQIGHMFVALGQGSSGSVFYLLPLASLLGGGLALNVPVAAGGLMAASALGWLAVGATLGAAINIFSITAVSLNALGALLAFASLNQESER